jgi:nudix-type nucleoside diphosphatase (YffH/AdpP family)
MALRVRLLDEKLLANGRFRLTLTDAQIVAEDGSAYVLHHEIYHYKPAAAVLLYDRDRNCVLLVRQFRLGAYLAGGAQPMIEVCAGMLDDDAPEACVIREAMEETGVAIRQAARAFDMFTSPGGMTEKISCFAAPYRAADRIGVGGGADHDEHIEVIEPPFDEALAMIARGEICDAKTIALLYYARARALMTTP